LKEDICFKKMDVKMGEENKKGEGKKSMIKI
jgi:hypothetical protein